MPLPQWVRRRLSPRQAQALYSLRAKMQQPRSAAPVTLRAARPDADRRLRLLGYSGHGPIASETYIRVETEIPQRYGWDVLHCGERPAVAPVPAAVPTSIGLLPTVEWFAPDLILVFWTTHGHKSLQRLSAAGVPFALRVHSFDFNPRLITEIQRHPLCVGVWAYPHHCDALPGATPLTNLRALDFPPLEPDRRDLVLSVSAGVPKKDFATLVDAFAALECMDRRIVIGTSNDLERLPSEVLTSLRDHASPPLVQVNLDSSQVVELLRRTSVLVYTWRDVPERVGMPSSIIEGLLAGAAVVVPDHPVLIDVVGPHARVYRTAADIVDHVNRVAAGGAAIDQERKDNRDRALARFADPQLGADFAQQLRDALQRWWTVRAA